MNARQTPHNLTRRDFNAHFTAAALAILGLGSLPSCDASTNTKTDSPTVNPMAAHQVGLVYGDSVLFNNATASRYVGIWKNLHGNPGIFQVSEPMDMFVSFVAHNEAIYHAQKALLDKFGPDKVRFIVEGLDQNALVENYKIKEVFAAMIPMHNALDGKDLPLRDRVLGQLVDMIKSGKALAVLNLLRAQGRIGAECVRIGHPECIVGADYPQRSQLKDINQSIAALVDKASKGLKVTDDELQQVVGLAQQRILDDEVTSQRHLSSLVKQLTNAGKICSIIIGAGHCKSGRAASFSPALTNGLEAEFAKEPNLAVEVWDPHDSGDLYRNLENAHSAGELGVAFLDTLTVQSLRQLIQDRVKSR